MGENDVKQDYMDEELMNLTEAVIQWWYKYCRNYKPRDIFHLVEMIGHTPQMEAIAGYHRYAFERWRIKNPLAGQGTLSEAIDKAIVSTKQEG